MMNVIFQVFVNISAYKKVLRATTYGFKLTPHTLKGAFCHVFSQIASLDFLASTLIGTGHREEITLFEVHLSIVQCSRPFAPILLILTLHFKPVDANF